MKTEAAMPSAVYSSLRKTLGTQERVAFLLGLHPTTLSRRENGSLPITGEAELAIRYLVLMDADAATYALE